MSISALARELGRARQTVSRYVHEGMPTSVEEAQTWILANKANRERPVPQRAVYPAIVIEGDDSEARFARLKDQERYLSGQIGGIQERTLPDIVAAVARCTDEDEKRAMEKTMFRVSQDLLGLRKEWRSLIKQIADIEFRRTAALGDRIPFGYVLDLLTSTLTPVFAYTRSLKDQTVAADIVRLFSEAVNKFTVGVTRVPPGYEQQV